MTKILNVLFSILKVILLLASFILTFYIVMFMFERLEKSYLGALEILVPYIILFIIMAINLIFDQRNVLDNMLYNIACCLVFAVMIICGLRAIYDPYLLSGIKMGYGINFNFYADMLSPLKSMIYLLIASNICLMISEKRKKKTKIEVESKEV